MACRWIRDPEIGRWHLPDCMGGAVYGPNGCTCDRRISGRTVEMRLERIEAHLAQIIRANPPQPQKGE